MDVNRSDLIAHFRELSDEELISRCGSRTLNDLAQSIAIEELRARGLQLPNPPEIDLEPTEYEGDLVTVGRFLNTTDAHLTCEYLKAAGVPAIVADAHLVQTNSLWAIAVGGARVQVPAARFAEAKEVIAAFGRGDFALPDDDVPSQ
jgi:hypothetical protein